MNSIENFGQPNTSAPWGNLPVGQQPWGGGPQWEAASQAPWRMSPWAHQGMPSGAAVQAPPTQGAQLPAGYFPQGTSADLSGFDPTQAGGGFYQMPVPQPQQPPQALPTPGLQPNLWESTGPLTGGQVFSNRADARASANRWNNQNVADSGEWNLSQGHKQVGTGRGW